MHGRKLTIVVPRRLLDWASLILLLLILPCTSCRDGYTEDPQSDVVKLRDNLNALASGDLQDVNGRIPDGEAYVLLFGYQGSIESLPVSKGLQSRLEALTPLDYERYVLAHIVGDKVEDYTKWEAGDSVQFKHVPFLIRGNPYRLVVETREQHLVAIRLE
jgi:hypothetical protein